MNFSSTSAFFLSVLTSAVVIVSQLSQTVGKLAQPLSQENESFETIRRDNKTYVDKTHFLTSLLNRSETFFYITRPKRFGKSTFLRMIQKFFLGWENLFRNLAIHSHGNGEDGENVTWVTHPVIYLDFSASKYFTVKTKEEFDTNLYDELRFIAKSYGVDNSEPISSLRSLINELCKKFSLPVIILIDDYDAPIQHANDAGGCELAKGMNDVLRTMLSEIKTSTAQIRLVLVTGVLRLTTINELASLNSFVDLTDDKEFATAFGFSKPEINAYFDPHIDEFTKNASQKRKEILKDLIDWYGGYRFSVHDNSKLLNPASTIKCLHGQKFGSFRCVGDFIRHVVDEFSRQRRVIDDFDEYTVKRDKLFQNYDEQGRDIPSYILLLFTGYLTIKNYDQEHDKCVLGFPNREIRETLSSQVCSYIPSESKFISELPEWTRPVKEAMREGNISSVIENLRRFDFPIFDLDRDQSARGLGRMRR